MGKLAAERLPGKPFHAVVFRHTIIVIIMVGNKIIIVHELFQQVFGNAVGIVIFGGDTRWVGTHGNSEVIQVNTLVKYRKCHQYE